MSKYKVSVEVEFPPNISRTHRIVFQGPFQFNVLTDSSGQARRNVMQYCLGAIPGTMERDGKLHFLVVDQEKQNPNSFFFPWGDEKPILATVVSCEEFA